VKTVEADVKRQREVQRDLKVVARFIEVYCHHQHGEANKGPVHLKTFDVLTICGKELSLCTECGKLLAHAFVKRSNCPFDPKPMCKKCPDHCYATNYAKRMREVMKFSGRKLVLSGRLDYLFHLFS
jgi:hypothetical protein